MKDYNFDEAFDRVPVAMAYVPWQQLTQLCENLEEGFISGTIFPELDKPFTGRRVVS